MTPTKALKNALARAGENNLSLPLGLLGMSERQVSVEEATKDFPDLAMILRLTGPDFATALAVACQQFTAAVIEAKTLGHVVTAEAVARKATATDARLVGGFLGDLLTQLVKQAEDCPEMPPLAGYSAAGTFADARVAGLALADEKHIVYNVKVDFDGGAKTGNLLLIFPTVTARKPEIDPKQEAWRGTMEKSVLGANSRLEAILCKLRLPLSEVTALSVGDVLHLTDASLDDVSVVASDRSKIVTAQLGRSGPVRALRIFVAGAPPKRSAPPEEMTPLTMNAGGAGMMPGFGADAPGEMPQLPIAPEPAAIPNFDPPAFDTPAFDPPAFDPPTAEDAEPGLPEGGFSINQFEAT